MDDTIESLRRKLEAATPGPWAIDGIPGHWAVLTRTLPGFSAMCGEREDAALIVAMHSALPALLAVAEAAVVLDNGYHHCLLCDATAHMDDTVNHDPSCALASLTRNDEVERER